MPLHILQSGLLYAWQVHHGYNGLSTGGQALLQHMHS